MNFLKTDINNILFLCFVFFLSTSFNAQQKHHRKGATINTPMYIESHIFPSDSLYICYVSYKIPFNNLLFVKNGASFDSGISVLFELKDERKNISRFFSKSSISTKKYLETLSEEKYLEGVTSFKVRKGFYKLSTTVSLANTNIDFPLPPLEIVADSISISHPIVLSQGHMNNSIGYVLNNFQNSIPFAEGAQQMLIPIFEPDIDTILVTIEQNGKKIFEKNIFKIVQLLDSLINYRNTIVIPKGKKTRYFSVDKFNFKLVEGEAQITIRADIIYKFPMYVYWTNKPNSLKNLEGAIDALRLIGFDDVADSLEDLPTELGYKGLFRFWGKFDDDKTTKFNKVMNEFYSRIDYITQHFNSLGKHDALTTDRGKIYLVYGTPSKIERKYSDVYNIIEVWTYDSINEKIYFSDKSGTGKFTRIR